MITKDRWFFAVSLVVSVLPFSVMAIALQFLPDEVPLLVILGEEIETVSKNRNLIIGLFCLVPVATVLLAGYLRCRRVIERNFYAVTVGAMVISLAFLCFVLYQLVVQARKTEIIRGFDFVGVISVCMAYVVALLGVPLYGLKPNDSLGFRNAYTRDSVAVWTAVHRHCSLVMVIGFTVVGTVDSFLRGYVPLVILLAAAVLMILYSLFVSQRYAKKFAEKPDSAGDGRENL